MVAAALRVVVMGVVGSVMNGAMAAAVEMPGKQEVLTSEQVWVLVGLSPTSSGSSSWITPSTVTRASLPTLRR